MKSLQIEVENVVLTRKQAIAFLQIDEKIFDNFFRSAGEFEPLPRPNNRGRFSFGEMA
jgi:hypothetical protein